MSLVSRSDSNKQFNELQEFFDQFKLTTAEETTRKLLAYDGPNQRLIGITYDGNRAYYFKSQANAIVCVELEHRLAAQEGLVTGRITAPAQLLAWVEKCDPYLGWTHPRYR